MKLFLSIFFISLSLSASIYKGQKEYVYNCVNCHKGGQTFIVTKTQKEWTNLLKNDGSKLAELHMLKSDAQSSYKYFKSKKYMKKSKYLKEFLVEYAKDSGKIPACN